jgi:hypothetical protein
MSLALLLNLSDNFLNQAQFNTVFLSQKEMDRVGVEPTTSAMPMDLDIPVAWYSNSFYTAIFDVYQDRRLRHNFNAQ